MINACELCAKIAIENAMKDEAMRVAKMKVAKAFAEQVIAPILVTLTEVPDHLEIGFRYHDPNARGTPPTFHHGSSSPATSSSHRTVA